jgi:choline-sulfatase
MRGRTQDWHERHHNEIVSQYGGTDLLIKRDALKYQWYGGADCAGPGREEVLFDLAADPSERANLVHEPRYEGVLDLFRHRRGQLNFGPNADLDYRNARYGAAGNA